MFVLQLYVHKNSCSIVKMLKMSELSICSVYIFDIWKIILLWNAVFSSIHQNDVHKVQWVAQEVWMIKTIITQTEMDDFLKSQ